MNKLQNRLQIQLFVDKVLNKLNYSKPTIVRIINDEEIGNNAGICQGNYANTLFIAGELLKLLTKEELLAVIYHEIGHLFHSPGLQGPQWEHFADSKAVEFGADPKAIISSLKKVIPKELQYVNSQSHPSLLHRANYMSVKFAKSKK